MNWDAVAAVGQVLGSVAVPPGTWQRFWYDCSKEQLNPDAVRYVDRVLAESAPNQPSIG
jgi:hypothetical protein